MAYTPPSHLIGPGGNQRGLTSYNPRTASVGPVSPAPSGVVPMSQVRKTFNYQPGTIGKKEEEEKPPAGGLLGRGLGMVLNNPVVGPLLRPLDVLDIPRRAVWSTINEVVDAAQGEGFSPQDWYDQINPFYAITQRGDPTFGSGDVIPDTGNKWLDRIIGLTGDVALDPLTYVGGLGFAADAGSATSKLSRMTRLAQAADKLQADTGVRFFDDLGQITEEGAKFARQAQEVASTGRWGKVSPELRQAAGVSDTAGVRFRAPFTKATSGPMLGTRAAGEAISNVLGGVRGRINATDFGQRLGAMRTPNELANAMPLLTRGTAEEGKFLRALEAVPTTLERRAAKQTVQSLAASDMRKVMRQVKEYLDSGNTIDDLIRNTEDPRAADTPLNWLANRMREHAQYLGVDIPEIADIGYFPHVLSREFKDLLHNGGEDVQRFLDQSGIVQRSLLGDEGFLQGRRLRPRSNGEPLRIALPSGRAVEITTGTVDEINTKMRELFPQLKGTALETDPRTALERYIDSVSGDIANRVAEKKRIEAGSGLYGNVGETRLAAGTEGPVSNPAIVAARGEDPYEGNRFFTGVRDDELSAAANQAEASRLAEQLDVDQAAANAQRRLAASEISATGADVQRGLDQTEAAIRGEMADELASVRARQADLATSQADLDIAAQTPPPERLAAVEEELADIPGRKMEAGRQIIENRQTIRKIEADTKQAVDGLKEYLRSVNARIAGLRRQSKRLTSEQQAAWRTAREADVANARNELQRLQEEAANLRTWSTQSQDRLNYQAAQKMIDDFNEELRQARQTLDEVTGAARQEARTRLGRPEPARVQEARKHLASSPNVERYDNATEVVKRLGGRKGRVTLTPEQTEELNAARKFLRTKAAKRVKENRKIIEDVERIDPNVARSVHTNPEVNQARIAVSQAERSVQRTRAIDKGVSREEIERLFPPVVGPSGQAVPVDFRTVSYGDYLQRLRRSHGAENTISRRTKLGQAVKAQEKQIEEINRGLVDLFKGEQEKVIAARNQADLMWREFPEQMRRQQIQSQIVSIPEQAQVQMEALDAINTNLRLDYQAMYINQQARQAERDVILSNMEEGQRRLATAESDLALDVERTRQIEGQVAAPFEERLAEVETARAAPGRRSIDPAAEMEKGKVYRPKVGDLKSADLNDLSPAVQPLDRVVDDISVMARLDPGMTNEVYGSTEALLMQHRQMLNRVTELDITARQTEELLREANSGRLVDVVAGQLRDNWTMLPGRGDTVVDTELYRMLTNIIDLKREPGLFGRTLNSFTNFFKTYATLTPGFHIRNAMSAIFMNTVDGVPLRTQQRGLNLWREFAKQEDAAGWLAKQTEEVQSAFQAAFASGAGGRFFESGVADATAAVGRGGWKEGIYRNRLTTASQRVGQDWVEGPVRLGMALDSVSKGDSVMNAYQRIARIHFDYAAVSKFDEQAKKLVPFWTFTSRNLPMQISEMWSKPKVYAWYSSFVRNFGVEPEEFTPDYFESIGAFNTGEKMPGSGLPLYLQPDLPHLRVDEDITRLEKALSGDNIGQVLSDVNPFFTAPIEYVTDTNLYTGKKYKPTDWSPAEGFADKAMLPLLALMGQTKRGANGEIYVRDKGMDFLRSTNPLLDRTIRMVPGASQSTGDPSRQLEAMLRTAGFPIRTLSPQQQEATQRSEYFKRQEQLAMERVLRGG